LSMDVGARLEQRLELALLRLDGADPLLLHAPLPEGQESHCGDMGEQLEGDAYAGPPQGIPCDVSQQDQANIISLRIVQRDKEQGPESPQDVAAGYVAGR